MYSKLMGIGEALAIAAFFGGSARAGGTQNCPEVRSGCQPIGDRPGAKKPKPGAKVRSKASPKLDSSGQWWRAGNHVMQ